VAGLAVSAADGENSNQRKATSGLPEGRHTFLIEAASADGSERHCGNPLEGLGVNGDPDHGDGVFGSHFRANRWASSRRRIKDELRLMANPAYCFPGLCAGRPAAGHSIHDAQRRCASRIPAGF
jgi:hypothetical protein